MFKLKVFYFLFTFLIRSNYCELGSWDKWWAYEGISGPDYWGLINPKWMLCNKGKQQSPIDILPQNLLYDASLVPLQILGDQFNAVIENNGRGILLKVLSKQEDNLIHDDKLAITMHNSLIKSIIPIFSGGPLSYNYTLNHIIIHFGAENGRGSEHRINGHQFTGEIQFYAYNSQLYTNYSVAETSPNGLFALAFFIKLSSFEENNENLMLKKLIGSLRLLMDKEDESETKISFSLTNLINYDHYSQYITYQGSLTQPPCSENVIWLLGNKPLYISTFQMQTLKNLVAHDTGVGYNWRPIQTSSLNSIKTNIHFNSNNLSGDYSCSMKQNYKYFVNKNL